MAFSGMRVSQVVSDKVPRRICCKEARMRGHTEEDLAQEPIQGEETGTTVTGAEVDTQPYHSSGIWQDNNGHNNGHNNALMAF